MKKITKKESARIAMVTAESLKASGDSYNLRMKHARGEVLKRAKAEEAKRYAFKREIARLKVTDKAKYVRLFLAENAIRQSKEKSLLPTAYRVANVSADLQNHVGEHVSGDKLRYGLKNLKAIDFPSKQTWDNYKALLTEFSADLCAMSNCEHGSEAYYNTRKMAMHTLTRLMRFFNAYCGVPEFAAKKKDFDYIYRHSLSGSLIDRKENRLASKQRTISGIQSLVENVLYCKLTSRPLPEVELAKSTEKAIEKLINPAPAKGKKSSKTSTKLAITEAYCA